jgi:hypothetical protein
MSRANSRYASYTSLQELLTKEWNIEPPVYARPRWQSPSDSKERKTCHTVPSRDNQVNLVTIPESPEIQKLLAEYGLTVDDLSKRT